MKTSLCIALFASLAGAFVACSGASEGDPISNPPGTPDAEAPAPREASTDAPAPVRSCSGAKVPALTCPTTTPAPTANAAVLAFVKDNAIPIRCDGDEKPVWDLRPLVELYGEQKMFMIGEVHGQNEIGIVSSLAFEELASKDLVNVLGYELPMDFEPVLQRYIDGNDPTAEQLLRYFAENFFGRILTKVAKDLAKSGKKIRIAAVDIPTDPSFAARAIEDVATKLSTQKDTVLATLPRSTEQPPSAQDIQKANTYFDWIMGKRAAICAELSEADCDRLNAMTHALWAATRSGDGPGDGEWFARREEVIYYNLHSKMASDSDRMFLHMGAAHTNKYAGSGGSRMAHEYAKTKGQVFSVAPAYGSDSVIWYGGDRALPGQPEPVVAALSDQPDHPFFVSTTRPNPSCQKNPLEDQPEDLSSGGSRGETYDGYIHYGKLTSERRPEQATLSRDDSDDAGKRLARFRARIEAREHDALLRGGLFRKLPAHH